MQILVPLPATAFYNTTLLGASWAPWVNNIWYMQSTLSSYLYLNEYLSSPSLSPLYCMEIKNTATMHTTDFGSEN
jgi:hypothetical protein